MQIRYIHADCNENEEMGKLCGCRFTPTWLRLECKTLGIKVTISHQSAHTRASFQKKTTQLTDLLRRLETMGVVVTDERIYWPKTVIADLSERAAIDAKYASDSPNVNPKLRARNYQRSIHGLNRNRNANHHT